MDKTFPEIFQTLSGKSQILLSWSHYQTLLRVKDDKARAWYAKEAAEQTWAVRTLQQNIDTQYYLPIAVLTKRRAGRTRNAAAQSRKSNAVGTEDERHRQCRD